LSRRREKKAQPRKEDEKEDVNDKPWVFDVEPDENLEIWGELGDELMVQREAEIEVGRKPQKGVGKRDRKGV
jgi:hypothetical protein